MTFKNISAELTDEGTFRRNLYREQYVKAMQQLTGTLRRLCYPLGFDLDVESKIIFF